MYCMHGAYHAYNAICKQRAHNACSMYAARIQRIQQTIYATRTQGIQLRSVCSAHTTHTKTTRMQRTYNAYSTYVYSASKKHILGVIHYVCSAHTTHTSHSICSAHTTHTTHAVCNAHTKHATMLYEAHNHHIQHTLCVALIPRANDTYFHITTARTSCMGDIGGGAGLLIFSLPRSFDQ